MRRMSHSIKDAHASLFCGKRTGFLFYNCRCVKTGISRSYRKLIRLRRVEDNGVDKWQSNRIISLCRLFSLYLFSKC